MMTELAFYDAGCENPRGLRRPLVFTRRALRRVLRPIFQRQVVLYQAILDRLDAADRTDAGLRANLDELTRRHDDLNEQLQATIAFGWDYVALVRRVASLEDRLESLGSDSRASVPFPASEKRAEAC